MSTPAAVRFVRAYCPICSEVYGPTTWPGTSTPYYIVDDGAVTPVIAHRQHSVEELNAGWTRFLASGRAVAMKEALTSASVTGTPEINVMVTAYSCETTVRVGRGSARR